MNKTENFEFNLPNRDNPDELADINVIGENFEKADEILKEHKNQTNELLSAVKKGFYYKYDFNGDGVVDFEDCNYLQGIVDGSNSVDSLPWWTTSDVNGDGEFTEEDVMSLNDMLEANDPAAFAEVPKTELIDVILNGTSKKPIQNKAVSQGVANALKGTASGTVVTIGDVSPLEHNIGVKLSSDTLTDFSSVTLTKYGKNLFDENKDYDVGITEEHGEKVFYNTNTAQAEYLRFDITEIWDLAYSAGVKLSVSFDLKTQKAGTVNVYALGKKNVDATQFANATTEWQRFRLTFGLKYNTTGDETCRLAFFGGSYGSGVIPYIKNIQIELGDSVSEYEPYKKPVGYLPEKDGTVDGVTSLYPTTTLVTDTEGVTITAEYNRDINKAFAELEAKLQALILEV